MVFFVLLPYSKIRSARLQHGRKRTAWEEKIHVWIQITDLCAFLNFQIPKFSSFRIWNYLISSFEKNQMYRTEYKAIFRSTSQNKIWYCVNLFQNTVECDVHGFIYQLGDLVYKKERDFLLHWLSVMWLSCLEFAVPCNKFAISNSFCCPFFYLSPC